MAIDKQRDLTPGDPKNMDGNKFLESAARTGTQKVEHQLAVLDVVSVLPANLDVTTITSRKAFDRLTAQLQMENTSMMHGVLGKFRSFNKNVGNSREVAQMVMKKLNTGPALVYFENKYAHSYKGGKKIHAVQREVYVSTTSVQKLGDEGYVPVTETISLSRDSLEPDRSERIMFYINELAANKMASQESAYKGNKNDTASSGRETTFEYCGLIVSDVRVVQDTLKVTIWKKKEKKEGVNV